MSIPLTTFEYSNIGKFILGNLPYNKAELVPVSSTEHFFEVKTAVRAMVETSGTSDMYMMSARLLPIAGYQAFLFIKPPMKGRKQKAVVKLFRLRDKEPLKKLLVRFLQSILDILNAFLK